MAINTLCFGTGIGSLLSGSRVVVALIGDWGGSHIPLCTQQLRAIDRWIVEISALAFEPDLWLIGRQRRPTAATRILLRSHMVHCRITTGPEWRVVSSSGEELRDDSLDHRSARRDGRLITGDGTARRGRFLSRWAVRSIMSTYLCQVDDNENEYQNPQELVTTGVCIRERRSHE